MDTEEGHKVLPFNVRVRVDILLKLFRQIGSRRREKVWPPKVIANITGVLFVDPLVKVAVKLIFAIFDILLLCFHLETVCRLDFKLARKHAAGRVGLFDQFSGEKITATQIARGNIGN